MRSVLRMWGNPAHYHRRFKMAKAKLEGTTFAYEVTEGKTFSASLLALFPEWEQLSEAGRKVIAFALKTAARNATAGKMGDEDGIVEACEAVKTRLEAWARGEWQAARESGAAGESQASVLVRALARALGCTTSEAQEQITSAIAEALETASLDAETEDPEEKKRVRAVANAVRKAFKDAVAGTYAQVEEEDKAKKAASAKDNLAALGALVKR
jgi:hypothetical protein